MPKFFYLLLLIIGCFVFASTLHAQEDDHEHSEEVRLLYLGQADLSSEYSKKTQEIKELEKKLSELSGQSRTLSTQISNFNTQIKLTELKIEQTKTEIASLSAKIGRLETTIGGLSDAYQERVTNLYKLRKVADPLSFALSGEDYSILLSRLHYLRLIAEHDQSLLVRLQTSQTSLELEKKDLTVLEDKLEDQSKFLSSQRGGKEKLLELTKNDEKKYQDLLTRARAEAQAIASAMRNAINLLKDGSPIKKGSPIALIGNSGAPGCSTGPHLHFEVQKDGTSADPSGYLTQRDVSWDNAPDSPFSFTGGLDWPIDSPRITQGFGMTHWAQTGFYSGRPHTGIDMTSEIITIRAPVDGTLYKGTVSCGSSPMNFVAVDHGGGVVTWYWHVQ